MSVSRLFPLVLTLGVMACAKKDAAPTTAPSDAATTDHAHAHGEGAEHEHEHQFAGGVKSFHDTMAPLWHAPKDDARVGNTCAAAAELVAKAGTIESEPMPAAATDADAWKTRSGELSAAAKGLQTTCSGDRKDFEAAFTTMHEAFHALIELAGEKHE
ncbi:MAG: hypothetical protein K1X88_33165 [Nannocystaceae bacterium]|nr:hypothetical protein [Nannocystaceae bacterium]